MATKKGMWWLVYWFDNESNVVDYAKRILKQATTEEEAIAAASVAWSHVLATQAEVGWMKNLRHPRIVYEFPLS